MKMGESKLDKKKRMLRNSLHDANYYAVKIKEMHPEGRIELWYSDMLGALRQCEGLLDKV